VTVIKYSNGQLNPQGGRKRGRREGEKRIREVRVANWQVTLQVWGTSGTTGELVEREDIGGERKGKPKREKIKS